ncbi:NAD(P)H-binding protein [Microbacterium sp. zg.Y1090]|uniref:NAD(P)H-binding protein n=1 Tax=Microbacterium wangruii TaxID=3049073 RepID=UPI00214AF44E|nr:MULTISPECIES: NAD(P)H-binding protein [unclassified Microbacterium]MCR2817286.1 NAD(P)H-binding protein [Microbacterium sp. zg.Y1090]WIM29225.1 NAD(P)H-binding protein [Microbacterium sp. zg-Y1090]
MKVFIIGVTGAVGGLLAQQLIDRGDEVSGLVRREQQRAELAARGIGARVGRLADISPEALASLLRGMDAIVYSAGSNGGARDVTLAIDGEGVVTTLDAASIAGVRRFVLVSVLPEAGRGQNLSADEEFYFAVKKLVDVTVSVSELDWLILRPSMLVDDPGTGTVALGPAQPHDEIPREDVAATLAALLHEPRIARQILELNQGATPIAQAVRAARPRPAGGCFS